MQVAPKRARPATSMTEAEIIVRGHPRFDEARLAQCAREQGLAAAWRAALAAGPQAAARGVQGDFAVALRDDAGRTFLAVDRFGIRTLCYRIVGGELRYAERADALADATTRIDPQALYDYLHFHAIPSPRTIFEGVFRVPPAHCVWFEGGQLRVEPYWVATFEEQADVPFEQLRDEFRELLKAAVARRLDDGKHAAFLSGGTDSSTVAGMIGAASGRPAATYSIGFDAAGYDEMAYARIAAKHFGTEHHEYYITPDDLVRGIPAVARQYDQPFGNSSALPAYYCAKLARDDGVSMMLAGDGGDELFGGNSRYAKQRVFDWYGHVPAGLRSGVLEPLLGLPGADRIGLLRKGRSYVEQARVPMPDRLHMYNLLLRLGPAEVLAPEWLARIDLEAPLRQQRAVWASAQASDPLNRTLAYDWRYTLAESDLPKVCQTTALAGVDVGFPFLDDALLAFSLRLPADYKLRGLKLRWFFKEALRGFLPDEIIVKKKQGFGLPFGVWATQHAGLRKFALDSLDSLASRGVVRPEFVRVLVDRLLPEHPGYYGEMVWILMMLEQWLQQHAPQLGAVR